MPDWQLTGAVLGLAGALVGAAVHRRSTARAWSAHLLMAAAMTAQAVPAHDPLGPAGWTLALGLAAAWTLGRPGTSSSGSPPAALDLYAMAATALLAPVAMPMTHGETTMAATQWGLGLYVTVLALWLVARLALTVSPPHERKPLAPATPVADIGCATLMMTGMTLMVWP